MTTLDFSQLSIQNSGLIYIKHPEKYLRVFSKGVISPEMLKEHELIKVEKIIIIIIKQSKHRFICPVIVAILFHPHVCIPIEPHFELPELSQDGPVKQSEQVRQLIVVSSDDSRDLEIHSRLGLLLVRF